MSVSPHYVLRLKVSEELKEMYSEAVRLHNREQTHPNAGFDLFCPAEVKVYGYSTEKIDQGVKGAMEFCSDSTMGAAGTPVGYFMYPRSSTGSKTPLRLANSIGVIDSGYRGNYIAVFDNWKEESYKVEKGQRLVQICPPNLTYPMKVIMVDELVDMDTERGTGGFGSSGR
jgi:dUTP pyrophosphatase